MTADPAAPPPVALTQERIAELRALLSKRGSGKLHVHQHNKVWCLDSDWESPVAQAFVREIAEYLAALWNAAPALLSAASSGAAERARAEAAEATLRECKEQAEWELARGHTPSKPALTRIATYCDAILQRQPANG